MGFSCRALINLAMRGRLKCRALINLAMRGRLKLISRGVEVAI